MENRRREPSFHGTTADTTEYYTVFVDTSFDTRLAITVYKTDTVLDFKEKIASEHMHCFPKIGDIQIHSVKVKREANFYHLPDSMLVWTAFLGANGDWFLSVDASSSYTCHLNQNSSKLDLTKKKMLDVRNVDSSCRGPSSDINRTQQIIPISLEKTTTDIQNSDLSGKKNSRAKKKRKKSHTEHGQDVRADKSGAIPFKVPNISAGLMDAQETDLNIQDTDTSTIQKKRKRKSSMKPANNTVDTEKREPAEENQHSSGNGNTDVSVVEKENDIETTDKTNKNAKEEINMLKTSDVQEDLPITDQKNDMGIHKSSSHVPARESEEKLEEKHAIAVKTDDLARATEEIDFKEYFVHSGVKSANQSSMEMKSMKKVKTTGLPSVSMSTDVQSPSKLSADHKSKNKSHVRKDSGERQGDSAHNSDSSRRSSRALENGVKDSSTSERLETNQSKPKEKIAESSILNKKNASAVKSRLEKLPGKSGKKGSLFGVNELRTPKKGTAHSNGSKRSPSPARSSTSDHSMSESALSQDSTKNGSTGSKGQSKGRSKLDILKDSGEEITMDMILRNSKRFKKAKLIALENEAKEAALEKEAKEAALEKEAKEAALQNEAKEAALQNEANEAVQNESESIEFVPDSLPLL